ncbi:MAG TPA: hypothetical protein VNB06_23785 [Thermoanaerobaculia bacterium]|nr:hypothetical protein [Thermoanaerobaculia bacterium]
MTADNLYIRNRSTGQFIYTARGVGMVLGGLLVGACLLGTPALAQQPAPDPVWFGQEAAIEELLRHGEVVASKELGEGITRPLKVTLLHEGRQLDAIWKPLGRFNPASLERYEAEVAAYRLSRYLGLDMVPPTVPRRIGNRLGSVQMWVHGYKQAAKVEGTPQSQELGDWTRAVARMRFFDELIDNPDRHAANYLVDDTWNVVLIDHSRALYFDNRGPMRQAEPPNRFDRSLVDRTRELDMPELQALLGDLFSKSELRNVLHRRNVLLAHVDDVVSARGELAFYEP